MSRRVMRNLGRWERGGDDVIEPKGSMVGNFLWNCPYRNWKPALGSRHSMPALGYPL